MKAEQKSINNKEMINVAVIVPVFNTEKYLSKCLSSLLRQNYFNFSVFVIDDGSTDNSRSVARKFAEKDNRIILIEKSNEGVSSARNAALRKISATDIFDLVCFVDSDDYVTPNFLETFVNAHVMYNADYIVCGWCYFDKNGINKQTISEYMPVVQCDSDGAYKHAHLLDEWSKVKPASASYFLANRCFSAKLLREELFDENLKKGEDQELLMRVLRKVKKGVILNDVTYMYRIRKSSLTHLEPSSAVSDLLLFVKIIRESGHLSNIAKKAIYSRTFELWWQSLRSTIRNNTYDLEKNKLREAYNVLKINKTYIKKSNNANKRFIIYLLGEQFMRIYFSFQRRPEGVDNNSAYE